jgi:uncharacterized protein with GYD domain
MRRLSLASEVGSRRWRTGDDFSQKGGLVMPAYVILMNLTEQGVKNIKDAPARLEATTKALEAAGGKLTDFYVTMGPYDYVAIAEGPGDEVALAQLLGLGMQGNVRTMTLKAFTKEELAGIVKKLP